MSASDGWRSEIDRLPAMRLVWCCAVLDREAQRILAVELRDLAWSPDRARCVVRSLPKKLLAGAGWPEDAADRAWWQLRIDACRQQLRVVHVWDGLRMKSYWEAEDGAHSCTVLAKEFMYNVEPIPLRGVYMYAGVSAMTLLQNWAVDDLACWGKPCVRCSGPSVSMFFIFSSGRSVPDLSLGLRGEPAAMTDRLEATAPGSEPSGDAACFYSTSVLEWLPDMVGAPPLPRLTEQVMQGGHKILRCLVIEGAPLQAGEEVDTEAPGDLVDEGIHVFDEITREVVTVGDPRAIEGQATGAANADEEVVPTPASNPHAVRVGVVLLIVLSIGVLSVLRRKRA